MRETITDLKKRLALEPHDEALTLQLAALYERNDERGEARELLKSLLRVRPEAYDAHKALVELNLTSWPTYRGDARRQGRSEALPLRQLPVVRWSWESRHPDQAIVYPPIVEGRRALIVTASFETFGGFDPITARLVCIDVLTGAQLWSQKRTCMPGVPTFDGDAVLWGWLAKRDNAVYPEIMRFHADTGEMLWYCNGPSAPKHLPYDPSPLLLHNGLVHFASNGFRPGLSAEGGYFTVVDAASGELVENFNMLGPRTPVAGQDGVYFYNDDAHLYRYAEGSLQRIAEAVSPYLNMSCPIAGHDSVFMLVEGQTGARLMQLTDEHFDTVWRFGSEGTFAHSPCLGHNGELFIATGRRRILGEQVVTDGHLAAIDVQTGGVLGSRTEPWRSTCSPTLVDGVLYICGEFSQASQLNAELPPDLMGDVVLPDDMQQQGESYLYPGGVRRCLSAFDTRRGFEPLWRMPIPDHVSASIEPVPVGDMMLIQYGQGRLVALAPTR